MSLADDGYPSNVPPLPSLGPVLDFMRLVWALDHALQRTSKRMDAAVGVTSPQRLVLRLVGRFPTVSAGQLAKALHLHPSTLTGILDRLERRALVQRRQDPHDKRRSLFGLTAKGRSIDVDTHGTFEAAVTTTLASLTPATVNAAREVLSTLTQALQQHG